MSFCPKAENSSEKCTQSQQLSTPQKSKVKKRVKFYDDLEKAKREETEKQKIRDGPYAHLLTDFQLNPEHPKWKINYEKSIHVFKKQSEK